MLDHLRAIKNGLVNVSEAKAVVADAKRLRRLLGPAVAIVVVAVSAEQVGRWPTLQHRRTHALHGLAHARASGRRG